MRKAPEYARYRSDINSILYPIMPESLHIANGHVWTGDSARPWADSLYALGGRVMSAKNAAFFDEHRTIDARGSFIVPGLIDAHTHLLMGGKSLSEVDLSAVRSRDEFEAAIARGHAQLPAGRWLIGRGWSEQNWPDHAMPDKHWLAAAGDRPCVCHRVDIHAAIVNEPVLRMIGERLIAPPAGGVVMRDPSSGDATGLLLEAAAWEFVNPLIPEMEASARQECLLKGQQHCNALGLTGVGSMEFARDVREVFMPMKDSLTLRCAITLLDRATGKEEFDFAFGQAFENDWRLSVIGCKTFIDGTLGSRTARMLAAYSDDPHNRGMLVELAAAGRLNEWARQVASRELSPSMHAIGDEAVRLALDACEIAEAADAFVDKRGTPRIEHAQHIDPSDIPRFENRIASMQPLHKADDGRYIEQRLGNERARNAFAFRSLRDAGAILAFGSDWPVVSCDPILGMRAAITGLTLDDKPFNTGQNLTPEEALIAYTAGSAYALQMLDVSVCRPGGVGGLADCVMLDCDPFTADWVRRPPRVVMTIVGGEVVFDGR